MGAAALKQIYMPEAMDPDLVILPRLLSKSGYSTHMVGKWHLGQAEEHDLPHNKGFDTFFGLLEAQMDYKTHKLGHMACLRNNSGPVDRSGEYITPVFTEQVLATLHHQEKPTFTYLAYNAPHLPVTAPFSLKEKLKREYSKHGFGDISSRNLEFHGAVRAVDMGIEKLFKEAAKLDRETIFIFTSDNGGAPQEYDGCNFPYRGGKSKFEEGGIKAPTLIFSTKRTFATRQTDKLFHVTDWFSTILGLGKVKVPQMNDKYPVDGLDFSGDFGEDKVLFGTFH